MVEGDGLENRWALFGSRGFESLLLRFEYHLCIFKCRAIKLSDLKSHPRQIFFLAPTSFQEFLSDIV